MNRHMILSFYISTTMGLILGCVDSTNSAAMGRPPVPTPTPTPTASVTPTPVPTTVPGSELPPDPTANFVPPIGIPMPDFGIKETAPASPSGFATPVAGFYYVNEYAAGATDANNPYGSSAKPRRSIPQYLPAGSVVEVHGYYDISQTSPATLTSYGTAAQPVFIRGESYAKKAYIARGWEIRGTYAILENLNFADADLNLAGGDTGYLSVLDPGDHLVVRHNEFHGNLYGGGIGVVSWGGHDNTNTVIFHNSIHDNGDVHANYDQDVHGIAVGTRVSNLWVLDNEMARSSGDGIQINGGTGNNALTHHIYVGRNHSYGNKQTGVWVKEASDVIISQNVIHGHHGGNSSYGSGTGYQYGPERVWFLYNEIYDCDNGIGISSDQVGQNTFYIGNLIHDLVGKYSVTAGGWGPAGIVINGGINHFILNNTMYNVPAGINSSGQWMKFIIGNNIISGVQDARAAHIFLEADNGSDEFAIFDNLFYQGGAAARIQYGAVRYDVTGLESTLKKGVGNLTADPRFVSAASGDFRLQAGSPAIDSGEQKLIQAIADGFKSYYGIPLAVPQGNGWNIGALE